MDTFELITNVQNDAAPPKHVSQTLEARREADFEANVATVAAQLEAMGFDPVAELVVSTQGEELSAWQKTRVKLTLLEYCHPKLRATEHSGKGGGAIPLVIFTSDDENI